MRALTFVKRDPDKGYFGRQLWLPKNAVNVRSVKAGLEFPIMGEDGLEYLQLWEETPDHVIVPREFIPREQYTELEFPIIAVCPGGYPRIKFKSNVVLDAKAPTRDTQRRAYEAMLNASGGILNLACLAGDTVVHFNRGRRGFNTTLEEAYQRFNGYADRYNWDPAIPTQVRVNKGGIIGLNEILHIIHKGKKLTYALTLEDGKTLRLTADHEVLTTHGWMQLKHLHVGDQVITDGEREASVRKPKQTCRRLSWYPSHPFVRSQKRKGRKTLLYQIEEHRVVAEALINNLSFEEYRERCKRGKLRGLQFIDPSKYHVHHIDENPRNNSPDNLEILSGAAHLYKHRPGATAFGYGIPTPVRVSSIQKGRYENVYDIQCFGPHHNFVANGMVVHNCGKGKSVIALHAIAKMGHPSLIIVNNTTLINQWREYIRIFLEFEGGVGLAQGHPDTWDWVNRPIVLAMLHSLSNYSHELPAGFANRFGIVIWDEIHHLSAPVFSQTAPIFPGKRFGLTATEKREDGLEAVYIYNVGSTFYRDLMQEIRPQIYFQNCPVQINWKSKVVRAETWGKDGKLNIPKLRSYLGKLEENNSFVAHCVRKAVEAGRKVLVLSHSVDQLRLLHGMFPNSGLCTGEEKPADRIEVLHESNPVFGTTQLVREGLDEDTLDALYFVTPFGSGQVSEGGHNTLQQGMGRTQRVREGKKIPIVVIVDHLYIPQFHRMCNRLKQQLRTWPDSEGGPYEYTVLKPYSKETIQCKSCS